MQVLIYLIKKLRDSVTPGLRDFNIMKMQIFHTKSMISEAIKGQIRSS